MANTDPLLFQCLLDRAIRKLISMHSSILEQPLDKDTPQVTLILRERNAIRYMAGFVMLKLKQRHQDMLLSPFHPCY